MSSTVLLVDAEPQVREIIEQHLDPAQWTLLQVSESEEALQAVRDRNPTLVVVNVDVAKGWPLCSLLKRSHTAIPVIVVSFRLGKEVFNNHQKLDTRADAYHRLPDELEMLEISLGYFSSHRSETGQDDDDGPSSRPRPRRGGRVAVPSGVIQRLETTLAEQARALEDAKRQIEALEAERDAVAEKNRRQMLELMAVGPTSSLEMVGDTGAMRERIATLEAQVLSGSHRDDELNELRAALASATAALATKGAELERVHGERAALDVVSKQSNVALDEARNAGERTRQALEAQVLALRAEKAQLVQRFSELEEANRGSPDQALPKQSLEAAREAARREASDAADQLAAASVQLSNLASELTLAHQVRLQAEREKRVAEERLEAVEQQLAQVVQRAESAESAWSAVNARLEQVHAAFAAKSGQADQQLIEKKSVEQALATSRRLMREYATDAARKAEELKSTGERLKELEAIVAGFEDAKEELTQALEFEKSLVESLEKDLATAKAAPTVAPAELQALQAQLAQERARVVELETLAAAEIEALKAKAALEIEAAKASANEDLDMFRLVAQEEIEDLRAQVKRDDEEGKARSAAAIEAAKTEAAAELAAAKVAAAEALEAVRAEATTEREAAKARATAELEAAKAQAATELEAAKAQAAAALEATRAQAAAELEATRAQAATEVERARAEAAADIDTALAQLASKKAELEAASQLAGAAHAAEREALATHVATVHSRFEALVSYARALESRLVNAESRRGALEAKLEELATEVRSQTLAGEIPPPMELPTAPTSATD